MIQFMWSSPKQLSIPSPAEALPGRSEPLVVPEQHFVKDARLVPPFPDGMQRALFGMGCFWGAERKFWQADGVYSTAVGYAGGSTPNPTYREVCSGQTGHTEVVLVVYDPAVIGLRCPAPHLLGEPRPDAGHAPGQRCRYPVPLGCLLLRPGAAARRRGIVRRVPEGAVGSRARHHHQRDSQAPEFYYAEEYHQQYLAKNPAGYCGLGGTGVSCPVGLASAE